MQLQSVCHDTLPWLISFSLGDFPCPRMHPFRYAVSLRISHPGIDASVVSDTLGLVSKRTSPAIPSIWTHAYDVPHDSECAAFIESAASALQPHATFLRRIRAGGGRVEFFVGWFGDKNFGDTFPHGTLALLAQLQIDLSFDVYPDATQVT
jgi:hypothetical protein